MHIEPLPKKHKPISLTPLVDVIFLLLLFFMLSSTFSRFGQVEIGAPAAGGGSGAMPKAILSIKPGLMRLNGEPVSEDQLQEQARDLLDRDIDSLLVFMKSGSTTQQLVIVMGVLKSVDGLNVSVAGSQ
ncbi:biopolymer transporter ExbD [Labrenzia sp. PHM005]|uniref:ExbD/TolR family protein n=1 Tax=Labrenzia sp. PHM005 TaxID=2590016 RepID=UPI0011401BBF|nr:biopolymer transporter ExbD [Labrenzia sp. PHM005]QDG77389.1 biopolymer transporter ExbD [Labrenzia sp. PHM005]